MNKHERLYAHVKKYYAKKRGLPRAIEMLAKDTARIRFPDGSKVVLEYNGEAWVKAAEPIPETR